MFFLINIWGLDKENRMQYDFFLSYVFWSLFLLLAILIIYSPQTRFQWNLVLNIFFPSRQCLLWWCFFIGFAIKYRCFLFILTSRSSCRSTYSRSVFLAGLLLKLGFTVCWNLQCQYVLTRTILFTSNNYWALISILYIHI